VWLDTNVQPHDLQKHIKRYFLQKELAALNKEMELFKLSLASLFSSTAEILFIYKDMETSVNSPANAKRYTTIITEICLELFCLFACLLVGAFGKATFS